MRSQDLKKGNKRSLITSNQILIPNLQKLLFSEDYKMKIFHVNETPTQQLEAAVPSPIRLSAQEQLLQRQQRLCSAGKEVSLRLTQLREEYKDEIQYLIGPETFEKYAAQYEELLNRIAEVSRRFPRTALGEKEEAEYRARLKQEKHEFYHHLEFDTKR
jgi:hypothetical protein